MELSPELANPAFAAAKEEAKERSFEKVSNPVDFLQRFRGSETYQQAYMEFYDGKTPAADVTVEEMVEVFEEDEKARQALVRFSRVDETQLRYNPDYYGEDFRKAFREYVWLLENLGNDNIWQAIREFKGGSNPDAKDLADWDRERKSRHNTAARTLHKPEDPNYVITDSYKMARGLVDVMAIEMGYKSYSRGESNISEREMQFAAYQSRGGGIKH